MNVLIMDDEPLELRQLEFLMNKYFPAWKVFKAINGTEAIQLAMKLVEDDVVFHLALVDIKLPGKDGLSITEKLKEMMPDMDVIVISAFQKFEYAKQSIQLKVLDYLVKPIIEDEFVDILESYVKNNHNTVFQSKIISDAIEIIKLSYHEPIKLSEIADQLFVNSSYLSRLFSEETGVSFSEFLLEYRIKIAQELLIRKDWSIQHISDACGFSSQHYFSTSFKKITNVTPGQYREMNKLK